MESYKSPLLIRAEGVITYTVPPLVRRSFTACSLTESDNSCAVTGAPVSSY